MERPRLYDIDTVVADRVRTADQFATKPEEVTGVQIQDNPGKLDSNTPQSSQVTSGTTIEDLQIMAAKIVGASYKEISLVRNKQVVAKA